MCTQKGQKQINTNQKGNKTMNDRYDMLLKHLKLAKKMGVNVTFSQIDGWIKAATGKIHSIGVDDEGITVQVNEKVFFIDSTDSIFYDTTQNKNYYGIVDNDTPGYSLHITI